MSLINDSDDGLSLNADTEEYEKIEEPNDEINVEEIANENDDEKENEEESNLGTLSDSLLKL